MVSGSDQYGVIQILLWTEGSFALQFCSSSKSQNNRLRPKVLKFTPACF